MLVLAAVVGKALREEVYLAAKFSEYDAYRTRTHRVVPNLI